MVLGLSPLGPLSAPWFVGEFDPAAVIEKGVLHPVRDVLQKIYGCDYRFSVLELDPTSREWRMAAQAGHRLESQQRFTLEYDKSFSRFSFESQQLEWANDVDDDPRFKKHSKAEEHRGYAALMSVPILVGGNPVAVFNAIATKKNVFDKDRDRTRISLVGSIAGSRNTVIPRLRRTAPRGRRAGSTVRPGLSWPCSCSPPFSLRWCSYSRSAVPGTMEP